MKIKTALTVLVMASLLGSANAELLINGDLEADGYTNLGPLPNNLITNVTAWAGTTRISTTGDNNEVPEAPNTVFRLQNGNNVRQDFSTNWDANNKFTISLNACETHWRTSQVGNGLWVSLRSTNGTEYVASFVLTEDTHGGENVTYDSWQTNQTFSVNITGGTLIDAGATPGEDLRLNIYSKDINWVDNIGVEIAEAIENGVPVADDKTVSVDEDSSVEIILTGSDPDGDSLTYTVVTDPANGTLFGTAPALTYTPALNYYGTDSFTYIVSDGITNSAEATVSITVNSLPEPPSFGEFILNGDLEADGFASQDPLPNNFATTISNWLGNMKISTTGDGNTIPEAPNTVYRMQIGNNVYQNFSAGWDAEMTFTVSLNACEVYWRADADGNALTVSLADAATGTAFVTNAVALDGTHGGTGVTYENWQTNQTFSFDVTGAELIAAGATAGQNLRLNVFSHNINWVDNLSVTLPYDPEISDISIQVVSGGTEVALSWMTDSGVLYGVAACPNLPLGNWNNIITDIEGTGGEVTVTNQVSLNANFYRAYIED